jgi:uncharacterized protein (TIGR00251 family)
LTANSDIQGNWLRVKVTPGARRNEITGLTDGVLQVKVAAPPVKGKANKELLAFLSRALGVKKSAISIVKGQTSRDKVIAIAGLGRDDILQILRL